MVARHAKFEFFPWIRLDTAHALLERSYAPQDHKKGHVNLNVHATTQGDRHPSTP